MTLSKSAIKGKTHRLIPTKYPPIQTFESISTAEDLEAIMELEGWTNDRIVKHRLLRLPKEQWVYGTPNASVVMAAFLHTAPNGLRFNGTELGAWYCATHINTAIAEVSTHLRREAHYCNMQEIRTTYRNYTATLTGTYINLYDKQQAYPQLYHSTDWKESQLFGEQQRAQNENGIIYTSLRYHKGRNIVAYKPKNIKNITQSQTFDLIVPVKGKIIAKAL